eukprot:2373462-Prymnesium_polylepis.1
MRRQAWTRRWSQATMNASVRGSASQRRSSCRSAATSAWRGGCLYGKREWLPCRQRGEYHGDDQPHVAPVDAVVPLRDHIHPVPAVASPAAAAEQPQALGARLGRLHWGRGARRVEGQPAEESKLKTAPIKRR